MALATRADLLTAALQWLGRPGDTLISASDQSDCLTLAEGRIFYGAAKPFESPPVRVRAMEAYAQFPLNAIGAGASTGGTANAQTSALSGFTLAYGSTATVPSTLTNTGAMTLNIESSGVRNVLKGQNRDALSGGDWRADITYNVFYDGTQYILLPLPGAIPLPTDFLEMRRLWLGTSAPLEHLDQIRFFQSYVGKAAAQPRAFCTDGDAILFGPKPDTDYEAHMLYWKRPPAMTSPGDTNWLLTNYPSIYLYALIMELCVYLEQDDRIPIAHSLYSAAAGGVIMSAFAEREVDTDNPKNGKPDR